MAKRGRSEDGAVEVAKNGEKRFLHAVDLGYDGSKQSLIALGGRGAGIPTGPGIYVEDDERRGWSNIDSILGKSALSAGLKKRRMGVSVMR